MRVKRWTALIALGLVACSSCSSTRNDAGGATDPAPIAPATNACAEGFTAMEGDTGCEPIHAASACAPGTRPALGSTGCVAVGNTACADGFVADSSEWGCAPVVAPTACASGSGTIERLGSPACEPISDCSLPLPSGATVLLVDASLPDAAVDATHFKTIGAAVNAAVAGATIAVEAGSYAEQVTLAGRAVTIIGRCAERTILTPADPTLPAFTVSSFDSLALSRMTLRGHRAGVVMLGGTASIDSVAIEDGTSVGIAASNGATLTVKNTVARGIKMQNSGGQSMGLFVNTGATATVTDSVFASNEFMNVGCSDKGSSIALSRSIVRDGRSLGVPAQYGLGVYVTIGGTVTIDESAVLDNTTLGIDAFAIGTTPANLSVRRSVVRGTKLSKSQSVGDGIEVSNSHLVLEDSTVAESALIEVMVTDGATADISTSTLRGKPQAGDSDRGALGLVTDGSTAKARSVAIVNARTGVQAQSTGHVELDASLVKDTRASAILYEDSQYVGLGIFVESKASLTLTKSTIEGAHTVGLLTVGQTDVSDSIIEGTVGGLDGFGGRGLSVQNGGAATIARSAFLGNMECGVVLMLDGAFMSITDSTVKGTTFDVQGQFGIGMLLGGDVLATVDHCTVTGSAGVGVMVSAAGAAMHAGTVSNNAIGVNAQDGTTLMVGDQDADARSFVVSGATKFVGNQTRVGSGAVPLPTPITLGATSKK